jgi:hypothetical protein
MLALKIKWVNVCTVLFKNRSIMFYGLQSVDKGFCGFCCFHYHYYYILILFHGYSSLAFRSKILVPFFVCSSSFCFLHFCLLWTLSFVSLCFSLFLHVRTFPHMFGNLRLFMLDTDKIKEDSVAYLQDGVSDSQLLAFKPAIQFSWILSGAGLCKWCDIAKKDAVWLSILEQKWHCSFHLTLWYNLLWVRPAAMLWGYLDKPGTSTCSEEWGCLQQILAILEVGLGLQPL